MTEYAHLWLFFVILLGVVILPGLDMAFVLGSSITGGRSQGLVAVAGMVAGGIVHVVVGALGLAALLEFMPGAFNVILLAGALYIAWIGISVLRSSATFGSDVQQRERPAWATFRRAALTNLLNPKAYLFMLAIFPQFLRPEYGVLWIQAVVLGVIIAFTQASVYGSVAIVASGLRGWMQQNPAAGILVNRVVGGALILAAIATGLDGWRSLWHAHETSRVHLACRPHAFCRNGNCARKFTVQGGARDNTRSRNIRRQHRAARFALRWR